MHRENYYVGVDLGSETIAAYYERHGLGPSRSELIALQEHADLLVGDAANHLEEPAPGGGTRKSRRMRTRIGLINQRQPETLPPGHARLGFFQAGHGSLRDYKHSIFRFFVRKNDDPLLVGRLIPNPKVLFQVGGAGCLPKPEAIGHTVTSPRYVDLSADRLIHHLLVQLIRNLVLASPQLKAASPDQINLVVSIPNVYSLAHRQSIRNCLTTFLDVPDVKVMYESDAVAYFLLGCDDEDTELIKFREFREGLQPGKPFRLLTIDIGCGTTDLSLLELGEGNASGSSGWHQVLARTGRTDGGSRLTYLLVRHYNEQLRAAFGAYGEALGVTTPPFDFCHVAPEEVGPVPQMRALRHLETLAECVKRSIDADFRVHLPLKEQAALACKVIDAVLRALELTPEQRSSGAYSELRRYLTYALTIHPELPSRDEPAGLTGLTRFLRMGNRKQESQEVLTIPSRKSLAQLRAEVEAYVRANVESLIKDLITSAAVQAKGSPLARRMAHRGLGDPRCTFAVVAGRASHFLPMRHAVEEALGEYQLPESQICFLSGDHAKDACCRGAVYFSMSGNEIRGEDDLFGTYALRDRVSMGVPKLEILATKALNQGESCEVPAGAKARLRHLVFTPRVLLPGEAGEFLRETTFANLATFSGDALTVEYRRTEGRLVVNGRPVRVATFGDLDPNVYERLWPAVLLP